MPIGENSNTTPTVQGTGDLAAPQKPIEEAANTSKSTAATGEAPKGKTPEEIQAHAAREAQMAADREFYQSFNAQNWRRCDKQNLPPPENDEKSGTLELTTAADVSSALHTGKLTPGWYEPVKYDKSKPKPTFFIDDKNNIIPGRQTIESFREVIRAYSSGLGMSELKLTFPNATSKDDIPLEKALDIIQTAINEKVAIRIDTDPNLIARLHNPKKGEEYICKKILQKVADSQQAVANDPELRKLREDKMTSLNTKGLTDTVDGLSKAVKSLNEVATTDTADVKTAKVNEVLAAQDKVEKALAGIDQAITKSSTSQEAAGKYTKAIDTAKEVIVAAKESVKDDQKALFGDTPKFAEIDQGFTRLETKMGAAQENANSNKVSAKERVEEKISEVNNQTMRVQDAFNEFKALVSVGAIPADKMDEAKVAAQKLVDHFSDLTSKMQGLGSEAGKPDTANFLEGTNFALNNAMKAVGDIIKDPKLGEIGTLLGDNVLEGVKTQFAQMEGAHAMVKNELHAELPMQTRIETLAAVGDPGKIVQEIPLIQNDLQDALARIGKEITQISGSSLTGDDLNAKLDAVTKKIDGVNKNVKSLDGVIRDNSLSNIIGLQTDVTKAVSGFSIKQETDLTKGNNTLMTGVRALLDKIEEKKQAAVNNNGPAAPAA